MEEYTLTYFDMQGRAEAIRILFALADVPYKDVRIPHEDFPELKKTLPYGQLPVLQFGSEVLSQHCVIGRYLSRKFGYHGNDQLESAKIDEIIDAVVDHQMVWWGCCSSHLTSQEKELALKNYFQVATPKYLGRFEKILTQNGHFLVGENLTWADIYVFNHIKFFSELTQKDLIEEYPALQSFVEEMGKIPKIRQWLEKRPRTCVVKEEDDYDAFHNK